MAFPHHLQSMRSLKLFGYFLLCAFVVAAATSLYIYQDTPTIIKPNKLDTAQIVLDDDNFDWNSIGIELTSLVTDLIQIPTVRKNESQAALYLQKILRKEGISSKLIPHPERPDKTSLIAEIGPEDAEDGVILLAHLDTVEANAQEWSTDPFQAIMQDGMIYGRGALDMKGMAAMELMSFLLLSRQEIPLKTKIMFLAVPDEEDGGKYGAQFLLQDHEDLFDGYQYVLGEGGFGVRDFPRSGAKIFTIQTAEKGTLGIQATASAASRHGSMPENDDSSLNLVKFLLKIQELQSFRLTPVVSEFFYYLSTFYDFPENFLLNRVQNRLVQKVIEKKLRENPAINAMVSNTISITKLETQGGGANVIPTEAMAYLDIRLLPGQDPHRVFSKIQKIGEKYQVIAKIKEADLPSSSSNDTQFFDILYTVIQDNVPDAVVTGYLSPGATDNRFFRKKGFQCYGLIPVLISMSDVQKLHGANESISLDNLILGTKIIFETLVGHNQLASL